MSNANTDIRIIGTGLAVPGLVTNQDMIEMLPDLGITKKWLEENVGIMQRHVSIDGMQENQQPPRKTVEPTTNDSASSSSSSSSSASPPESVKPREVFPDSRRRDMKAAPGCCNSDLSARAIADAAAMATATCAAAQNKMENAAAADPSTTFTGLSDIDMIILSTVTPDVPVPGTSTYVMEKLGLNNIQVMDIRSACCGFTLALQTAVAYINGGVNNVRTVAVVGCEVGSIHGNLDATHPAFTRGDAVNCAMIGDAAAAFIVKGFDKKKKSSKKEEEASHHAHALPPYGIELLHVGAKCIGKGKDPGMHIPCGGSIRPFNTLVEREGGHYFHHDFKKVLEHGAELYWSAIQAGLAALSSSTRFAQLQNKNNNNNSSDEYKKYHNDDDDNSCSSTSTTTASIADVDLFIPHQANGRITSYAEKMGISASKCHEHFRHYGNTANASLALGVHLEVMKDELAEESIVMCLAAESTKWLHGTFVLVWHSLAVSEQEEEEANGGDNNKNKTATKQKKMTQAQQSAGFLGQLNRMKGRVWFYFAGWLINFIGFFAWVASFFIVKKKKDRDPAIDGNKLNNNNGKQAVVETKKTQ